MDKGCVIHPNPARGEDLLDCPTKRLFVPGVQPFSGSDMVTGRKGLVYLHPRALAREAVGGISDLRMACT